MSHSPQGASPSDAAEAGSRGLAVVTGASAGIGAATARALAGAGYRLLVGARRLDRLRAVAEPIGAEARRLDVTDPESVARFAQGVERAELLVNNAGAALGLDRLDTDDEGRYRRMWETNVAGVVHVTRALLPALRASGRGHIVTIGSTSGFEVYPGGGGYTATKHAVRALVDTLRLELLGEPLRVTEVAPGMTETEFSRVRFSGDAERAREVYRGMTPLAADDVAQAVLFAATRPPHVNVDRIVLRPRDQAGAGAVHRQE